MNGLVDIEIVSSKVIYKLQLRRSITIIKGNSATGKSHLVNLLDKSKKKDAFVKIKTNASKVVSVDDETYDLYKDCSNCVLVADEGNSFYKSDNFDVGKNYFVLITRSQDLPKSLTYSSSEIYEFCSVSNGKKMLTQLSNIYKNTLCNIIPDTDY